MVEKSKVNTIFVQVVDRPARKLILKRAARAKNYFEYCEEVPCEIWETLTAVKDALYEPIGMWLPENLRKPGTSEYAQGVEVPSVRLKFEAAWDTKLEERKGLTMVEAFNAV